MIFEGVIFTTKFKDFYTLHVLCASDGTLNGARVKDNNPLGTLMTVSLDFEEKLAREGRQGK